MKVYRVKVNGKVYEVELEAVSEVKGSVEVNTNTAPVSYGAFPSPVDEEIKKKIVGDDEIITCRPADLLKPEFEVLKEKYKDIAKCDEDVLSLALFENVAVEFLNKKYNTVDNDSSCDEIEEFNVII